MKSKLQKLGFPFMFAVVLSVVTISLFSDLEKIKGKTKRKATTTKQELVEKNGAPIQTESLGSNVLIERPQVSTLSKIKAFSDQNKQEVLVQQVKIENEAIRMKHQKLLDEQLFKKEFLMSKTQRKAEGLPPNKYYEQDWALTMNPQLGRPTGENLSEIRNELEQQKKAQELNRTPGDGLDNPWVERGPNNVGGRTKALIFDPTDATNKTVIAAGVSGGLWKNTDITAATSWTRMNIPEHLNVVALAVDPLNSSTWYAGTGESYTGDVAGNGIWKTTNAGNSWYQVFGGGAPSSVTRNVFSLEITGSANPVAIRNYQSTFAAFGNPLTAPLSAQIVIANDGTAPTDDACTPLTGTYAGKIVLIRRGTCSFESKVAEAEAAGAVGAIVMNNVSGALLSMADSGLGVSIPSVFISKEDGDLLVASLSGLTGTLKPAAPGDFNGTEILNVQMINDVAIKNNGGVSEIYAAVGDGFTSGAYANASNYGVYKSVNGGATWTKLTLPTAPSGNQTCPMDIEIAVGGKIWVSSTNSSTFGDGGGRIFVSTDNGATFTLKHTVVGNGGGVRVEIEASNTTADKIYVLSQLRQANTAAPDKEVQLLLTTNGFATAPTVLALPPTSPATETRLNTYGFTGAQSFYNLFIESDPANDANVYVGGINIHKSTNSGTSWTQISGWSTGNGVHSDQHAMTFRPGATNTAIFGNDGGVYYCASLTAATNTSAAIVPKNTGYNVTQFVGMGVLPAGIAGNTGDFFVAGAQDNGSNSFPQTPSLTTGAGAGITGSFEIQGGDGGIPLYSQDADEYMITNYVYNDDVVYRPINNTGTRILDDNTANRGLFYPAFALDSANDIVYSDFTDTATRVFYIRRYINIKSGTVTRVDLTNALLTSFPTAISPGKVTSSTLYVGTANGKLLRITNANTVTAVNSNSTVAATSGWTDITGAGFVGSVSDIAFGANDSQIFVTMSNYGVTSIWYTPNAGTNWYSIEGNLPDFPVRAIVQNPLATSELMIGTELGVWYTVGFNASSTANQALKWFHSYNGMSNVKVTDLDIQPNLANASLFNVYASTYGRGVFSSQLWFCGATTTTWNGTAWSAGVPTSRTAVVFAGNYTSTASLDACSVTVNTGAAVTFVAGHTLRVGDNITVNGTGSLTFNNDAALIQLAKHAVNTGNIIVKRNSTAMIQNDYTAWSSPVANQNLLSFSPNTAVSRFYQYLFTGTTTPTAYQSVTPSTNSFLPGKGYMIRVATNWSPTTPTIYNGQFTGVPNNGSFTNTVGQGFNLLGNPYASPIDAPSFIRANGKIGTLYYWSHKVAASGGSYPSNNYASYTLLGGVASANGSAIPNDKIQVGQGFFVNAIGSFDVKFENELRVDAATSTQFFRTSEKSNAGFENHRIWLNLDGSTDSYNQILIGYSPAATNGIDENVDGLMLDTSKTFLYNVLGNKEYVIQGKGLPFNQEDIVKLGLKVVEGGEFNINIEQLDGLFESQDVFIKDNYTNTIHDLKQSAYTFVAQAGTFNDRFELVYKKPITPAAVVENKVDVLVKNNELTIQSNQFKIVRVEVYDVLGKTVYTKSGITTNLFNSNQITTNQQALILKIQLENGDVVLKKIIM